MEIEKEIIKLSSCQKFLLIQSFRTMINIIDLENFKQKQINFRNAEISFIDYYDNELLIGDKQGKIYYKNESFQVHSGQFLSGIVKDGMLLSLGQDGLLKQTNIKTFQCLYSRQLCNHIKEGNLYLLTSHALVQYGQKIILINLENDVVETKYKINQQGPLIVKLNNLSRDYFSVLGKEGLLKIFKIGDNSEAIQTIEIGSYENYELFYMTKKTTILQWNQDNIIGYVFEKELNKQYEIKINNLQSVMQGERLLIVYDNISNPKLKQINNIESQKFKSLYQQEQLLRFNELQQTKQDELNQNKQQSNPIPIAFYDFAYFNNQSSIIKNDNIKPKQIISEQNLINVLKQSLIAKDKTYLEYALERTLQSGIVESVNSLQLEQLQELQHFIVDKLISYPEQTKKYLDWIKAIVKRGVGDFSKLYYLLEERTKSINKLEEICSKIQFNKLTQKPKQDKDYRKQQHTIYEEQQTDVVIIQGNVTQKQITEINYGEDQTSQIEDDFNQAYIKHKQELRQKAYQDIEEEAYDEEDIKF
ncbi:unnamed protein product [Paramecium primaurelia]|uniref:Uncharacterized protein n=1 Tax=Paramecium primaurelia TaxID=5886 RepID=A0A8S1NQ51_PARPR|nr:unnamed protein product [Paramecium primaurelia]